MDISVVIPLYNEEESIAELYGWIERVMKEHNFSYEVIFISDGSTDRSWDIIQELASAGHASQRGTEVVGEASKLCSSPVKGIKFRRNYGKSPALPTS